MQIFATKSFIHTSLINQPGKFVLKAPRGKQNVYKAALERVFHSREESSLLMHIYINLQIYHIAQTHINYCSSADIIT